VIEPPPDGFDGITERVRSHCLEDPDTGERHEVTDLEDFAARCRRGWKWVLRNDDLLESLHMQAWYFQVRHFPRLSWVRLDAPAGEWFITSDRGVAWIANGYADTPPAALRDPTAEVVAPLTKGIVFVGRHGSKELRVTPREVNRFVACAASGWVAGPTRGVVEQAIRDRGGSSGFRAEPEALRHLDPLAKAVLDLFARQDRVVTRDLAAVLGLSERMTREVLRVWTQAGFLRVVDASRRGRAYSLSAVYRQFIGDLSATPGS